MWVDRGVGCWGEGSWGSRFGVSDFIFNKLGKANSLGNGVRVKDG